MFCVVINEECDVMVNSEGLILSGVIPIVWSEAGRK
jgi:hypothetical protein